MTYLLNFPLRRFESLFGTAYPNLKRLSNQEKVRIVSFVLSGVGVDSPQISIVSKDMLFGQLVKISVRQDGRKGYKSAEAIEKYIRGLPRLTTLGPLRWWNSLIPGRRPSDSFLINKVDRYSVIEWLREHVRPQDFQIYTKYDEDISLGFKNGEHAVMFKLTFGEKDI